MKKSTWLALGVFALVLVAFLVIQNIESAPVETTVPTETPALRVLDDQDITEIIYEDLQDVTIVLKQVEPLTWTSPTDPEAQITAGYIEQLISYFSELNIISTLPGDTPLEDVGLASPQYTITFMMEDGTTYQLVVGDPTPMSDGYYTWIDESEIVVLPVSNIEYIPTFMYIITTPPTATPDPEATISVTPTP
ncbi:MAG: DUF4340 domain-containing protein [Anaerolineaceae bacterium]|nr:DUF4340 domain-containing protein [Anaerolineaceae bacterium]